MWFTLRFYHERSRQPNSLWKRWVYRTCRYTALGASTSVTMELSRAWTRKKPPRFTEPNRCWLGDGVTTCHPLPLEESDPRHPIHDPLYANIAREEIPAAECLADVVDRMLPYWHDAIVPEIRAGSTPLVVAHGNSLRALVKHLDVISNEDIVELNIPTGVPLLYELDSDLAPMSSRYLGDPEAAQAAADAVARQAG